MQDMCYAISPVVFVISGPVGIGELGFSNGGFSTQHIECKMNLSVEAVLSNVRRRTSYVYITMIWQKIALMVITEPHLSNLELICNFHAISLLWFHALTLRLEPGQTNGWSKSDWF